MISQTGEDHTHVVAGQTSVIHTVAILQTCEDQSHHARVTRGDKGRELHVCIHNGIGAEWSNLKISAGYLFCFLHYYLKIARKQNSK